MRCSIVFSLFALLLALLATPAFADVQVAFSPGNATETVVGVIQSAQRSIHVAAYGFTSRPIAEALIDAHAVDPERSRAAKKAAQTRKRNAAKRSEAATRGARTRARSK